MSIIPGNLPFHEALKAYVRQVHDHLDAKKFPGEEFQFAATDHLGVGLTGKLNVWIKKRLGILIGQFVFVSDPTSDPQPVLDRIDRHLVAREDWDPVSWTPVKRPVEPTLVKAPFQKPEPKPEEASDPGAPPKEARGDW